MRVSAEAKLEQRRRFDGLLLAVVCIGLVTGCPEQVDNGAEQGEPNAPGAQPSGGDGGEGSGTPGDSDTIPLPPAPPTVELRADANGPGRVTISPLGDRLASGALLYSADTPVTLTAVPDPNAVFADWSGDVESNEPVLEITLVEDTTVVANFSDAVTVAELFGGEIFAQDGTFLGLINDVEFDSRSIANSVGPFGSVTSDTSIWNALSLYGSPVEVLSAYNELSTTPPQVLLNGEFVAFVTKGELTPAVDPDDLARAVGREEVTRD